MYSRPTSRMDRVKAGDRVRVKNYCKKFDGEIGTVGSRDGYYVYVFLDCQPDNKEYPLEVYDNEVEKIETQLAIDPEWLRRKTREDDEESCMAGPPMTREEFAKSLNKQQEQIRLQQSLKDNVCALIQRDDVLILAVDYEDAKSGFPQAVNIQYEEGVKWK